MIINYDLAEIRTFLAVAEHSSFGRAADALGLSASAVSKRISELEQSLGVQLLERTTRSVVLTTAGRALTNTIAPVLQQMDSGLLSIVEESRGNAGWLDIGCVTTVAFSVAPLVASRFRQLYPRMHLRFHDDTGKRVADNVLTGRVAFAVNSLVQSSNDLHIQPVVEDPYVLVLPASHPLANHAALSWAQLARLAVLDLPLVALKQTSANRREIDGALARAELEAPWRDEVEHLSTMIGFLRAGGVAAVMPSLALQACEDLGLSSIPLIEPSIHRRIGLIRRKDVVLSTPAKALWDLFEDELRLSYNPSE